MSTTPLAPAKPAFPALDTFRRLADRLDATAPDGPLAMLTTALGTDEQPGLAAAWNMLTDQAFQAGMPAPLRADPLYRWDLAAATARLDAALRDAITTWTALLGDGPTAPPQPRPFPAVGLIRDAAADLAARFRACTPATGHRLLSATLEIHGLLDGCTILFWQAAAIAFPALREQARYRDDLDAAMTTLGNELEEAAADLRNHLSGQRARVATRRTVLAGAAR